MKPKAEKYIGIAFKVVKGKLVHSADETAITELYDGVTGEVIIDKPEKNFLPAGTILYARLRPTMVPTIPGDSIIEIPGAVGTTATIILEEPLRISFQRKKEGQLLPCKCTVPSLPNARKPSSVNEAYTVISEKFEPHRRSHTGNVFNCVYYQPSPGRWQPLGELRDAIKKH